MRTPPAGMVRSVKLLKDCPFRAAFKGVPSLLKRSTRTLTLFAPVFPRTISVAQPPPAANCGRRMAPSPPTPVAICGNDVVAEPRFVTGRVLKLRPRNRNPITAIGSGEEPSDVTVKVPVKSVGTAVEGNNSVTNFETCSFAA